MAKYGITFDVSGKSVEQMKDIERSLQKLGVTAKTETDRVEASVDHLTEHFDKLQERIVAVFALEKIKEFGTEVLHVTAEFEGFENRIKFASRDTIDATQNMAFLRDEVTKLHLPMRQVYEGFSEMEAGLRGTGIEGERLRQLFEGISTASATLHLPEYQLQRTLYDLKEIGEIGLNARIERSLSTALPNIGVIVQKTFGKSMRELQHSGISGSDFLTKLGPALKKNFESGLASYGESLQAKMNDVSNKFLSSQIELGEKLKPVYLHIMDGLISAISNVNGLIEYLGAHKDVLASVAKAVEVLVISWVSYVAVTKAAALATVAQSAAMSLMTVAEYAAAYGIDGLIFALDSLNVSFSATAIGAFSLALGVIIQQFMELNTEVAEALESLTHLQEMSGLSAGSAKHYQDIKAEMAAPDLNDIQRGEILEQVGSYRQQDSELLTKQSGNLAIANQNLKDWVLKSSHGKTTDFDKLSPYLQNQGSDFKAAVTQLTGQVEILKNHLGEYDIRAAQLKNAGATKPTYTNLMDPTGAAALHSSHLSGAEGGLGQAKIINIKIDRVMTVENHDNHNLQKHAEAAADFIVRAADNFAESQTGTY